MEGLGDSKEGLGAIYKDIFKALEPAGRALEPGGGRERRKRKKIMNVSDITIGHHPLWVRCPKWGKKKENGKSEAETELVFELWR